MGLKYLPKRGIIKSETRGRLENNLKKIKARESTNMDFKFNKVGDNFYENLNEIGKENMDKYLPITQS